MTMRILLPRTLELKQIRFSDLRPGPEPGIGNLGAEVLRGFVVTFDAKNRRVRFDRPAAEGAK